MRQLDRGRVTRGQSVGDTAVSAVPAFVRCAVSHIITLDDGSGASTAAIVQGQVRMDPTVHTGMLHAGSVEGKDISFQHSRFHCDWLLRTSPLLKANRFKDMLHWRRHSTSGTLFQFLPGHDMAKFASPSLLVIIVRPLRFDCNRTAQ